MMSPKQNALPLGAAYYIWRTVSRTKSPGSHSCSIQSPLGQVGELCKVKRIVKLNVMVQSANGFEEQPEVRHTWLLCVPYVPKTVDCLFQRWLMELLICLRKYLGTKASTPEQHSASMLYHVGLQSKLMLSWR